MQNNMNAVASSPTHLPEVAAVVEQLGYSIDAQAGLFKELENRLDSVLARRSSGSETEPSTPEPVRVPLANELHLRLTAIIQLNTQLRTIIDRIEL